MKPAGPQRGSWRRIPAHSRFFVSEPRRRSSTMLRSKTLASECGAQTRLTSTGWHGWSSSEIELQSSGSCLVLLRGSADASGRWTAVLDVGGSQIDASTRRFGRWVWRCRTDLSHAPGFGPRASVQATPGHGTLSVVMAKGCGRDGNVPPLRDYGSC
jgi:hypothetical protein